MHIFEDLDAEEGYIATIRLSGFGMKRNWQIRLRINYTILHVKGENPTRPE